ncbi:MAG TPA: transposase [Thermoanaerobaculia bacterium]|nr:transposase [Thermoanaerobaculia bacterium]
MADLLYRNRFRIPSARKTGWDYRWGGVYAVTICVQERRRVLSEISEGTVTLTRLGEAVATSWREIPEVHPRVSLDEWIVMPDHLHGILFFGPMEAESPSSSLGVVIGQFKKRSTKRIRSMKAADFAWQERFHDQIVPNARALERYRAYIRRNPREWKP